MCGIAGFNWQDKELIKAMNKSLKHRGNDDSGVFVDKGVSLGHQRLSIIDLSKAGGQPMCDKEGDLTITFNGEIYNFKELREEHLAEFDFKSDCDTEVLIYLYKKYGVGMLSKLNGMFAFCIYDSRNKSFFVARDRFGIKPLYYYWKDSKFIFASELKALLEYVPMNIDKEAVREFFCLGYTIKSICKDTHKLGPGEFLFLQGNKLQRQRYYSNQFKNHNSKTTNAKHILELLEESVKKRLIADVPVGAFLSGGVDSSTICALTKKHKENLKTFSIGFEYKGFDESKWSNKVAELLGTEHYQIGFSAEHIRKLIPKLTEFFDEPFADPAMIPTYLVSKVAMKHVKVCLSGDGGDEVFGGYERYHLYKFLKYHSHTPKCITQYVYQPMLNVLWKLTNSHFFNKGLKLIEQPKLSRHEIYAMTMAYKYDREVFKQFSNYKNIYECDFNIYLPHDILTKTDRASMARTLECRVPFLDHNLVGLNAQIPGKILLKKAVRNLLPKEIIHRKKQGFSVPLKHYFRNELKDYVEQLLFSKNKTIEKFINPECFKKLWVNHKAKAQDNCYELFAFVQFAEWLKKWGEKE